MYICMALITIVGAVFVGVMVALMHTVLTMALIFA